MEIYVGRRRDVNKGYWMSFENHSRLEETKKSIDQRCMPCLEKLHSQLQQAPTELVLQEPLNCWKIVVVLNDFDQCLDLLEAYQDHKLPVSRTVRGRIGTSDKANPKVTVIFQVNDAGERDELLDDLERLADGITSDYTIYYERGCQDLYRALCGDCSTWTEVTPIQDPKMVKIVEERVGKLLRGEYR
jgi:hypothetical protein